jgi:hypothetical protein
MLGQDLVVRDVDHRVVIDITRPIGRNKIDPDLGEFCGLRRRLTNCYTLATRRANHDCGLSHCGSSNHIAGWHERLHLGQGYRSPASKFGASGKVRSEGSGLRRRHCGR